MTTKQQPPAKKAGKPTIEQDNRDQNVGQREGTSSGTEGEKPTIAPDKHGNVGERGTSVISDDSEVE